MPKFIPKTILITGCSSGFGMLTAARLSSKGHKVIATMRDLTKQYELLSEVNRRESKIDVLQLDVTDKDSVEEAAYQVASNYGNIDVLINNAGYGIVGAFEDLTDKEIRDQMETNFFGAQSVTREFIPLMRHVKGAKIINLSSVSGFSASPLFGAYAASKWALEAFSESLRHELKIFGIDVLLVQPGSYKTKIFYENSKFASNFNNEQSPYLNLSRFINNKVYKYLEDLNNNPENVAKLIEKLINSKNPPFRIRIGIGAKTYYFFKKILPYRIYEWLYRKIALNKFSNNSS